MRFLHLELPAFGSFTNMTVDFSTLQPGFHLLYGANEAGKSTLRRALMYLLFGIPERTIDAHLHTNEQLLIGGRLNNDDGMELHCYRRKGRKNTLLDDNNNPLKDTCLQPFLGNINEAQFNALFCFDHERLRQGGTDLLNNGGHLGESLFEAGTGTLKIHTLLSDLDKEAGDLFKPRATKPKLNQIIRTYKSACQRVKDCSLSVQQWQKQASALEEAQARYTQLTEQLQKLRTEQHRLARIQRTLPLLQRYHALQIALSHLDSVLLLPDNATTQRLDIINTLNVAQAQESQALLTIAELEKQLAGIQVADNFLSQKTTIDSFRERLGWHQKAARDLPGVRTELRTLEIEAMASLQRIYPHADLQHIPAITDLQRERLKQLADKYPLLCEKQTLFSEQSEKLSYQLTQYQETIIQLPSLPDLSELKAILPRAVKYSDLEDTLLTEKRELSLLTTEVELGLKQLGLWRDSVDALEHTAFPSHEAIERFDRRFKELESDRQRIKERVTQARDRYNRTTERINALRWAGEVPTEESLIQARYTRHQHWERLKNARQNSPDLVKMVEETILKADEIADRLRREASRVADQANLLAEQQSAQLDYEQLVKKWQISEQLLAELTTEWEVIWQTSKIKPWPPAEMRVWLHECINLRQQVTQIRERRQRLTAQQQFIATLGEELQHILTQLCEAMPLIRLADLVERAQVFMADVLALQRRKETLENQINEITQDLQQITLNQRQVTKTLAEWQADWVQAILPLQLSPDTPPEIARNLLDTLDQVHNKVDKVKGLRRRVERMEEDATHFFQEVESVVQKLMPDLSGEPVEHTVPILFNQLNKNEKNSARYEQLWQRLQMEQQHCQQAGEQVHLARAHLQALLEQAHCDTVEALEIAEQNSARKKSLLQQLSEVEQQLLEQGEGLSVAELAEAVKTVDRDQLPNQLAQLKEQISLSEQTRSELDRTIGEQQVLLKQMDGNANAAQAADESQSALAEIQALSERYMELHLASAVLRQAIESYREQYQGPLIQRASELFSRLTLEKFCGLKIGYQETDDQPILLGLRTANSEGIPTEGMSDGTHDQLYLALRLASIEQYMAKSLPLPLILDDILINFDDERSHATLTVLSELSDRIQILFLTHHLHLVELARQAIPNKQLKIHQL